MIRLFIILSVLPCITSCHKNSDITGIVADIVIVSVDSGHIYNIFALDRIHTHSYLAVTNVRDNSWLFEINDIDILGESGELIMDPSSDASVIVYKPTTQVIAFTDDNTHVRRTVQFSKGARLFIDFKKAQEAKNLLLESHEFQRNTLLQLATDAIQENFSVATH